MTAEPEDKPSSWDKIDPRLQRAAWITTTSVGLVTIGSTLAPHISKVPIPSLDVSVVVFQFGMISFSFYIWWKQPLRLANWFNQHFFIFMIALSFLQASYGTTRIDSHLHIHNIGIAWIFVGCGWIFLSILAAYARDKAIWTAQSNLAECDIMLSDMHARTTELLSVMSDNIVSLGRNQEGEGKLDSAQLELFEHLRREIESLKASIPKKRKSKSEPASTTLPPSEKIAANNSEICAQT